MTTSPSGDSRGGSSAGDRGQLHPVTVSRDRVLRTIAGLRPYRAAGFVVRREKLGDKSLVHHYGHGGGGLSLSWGTAQLAMEEALSAGIQSCAVLGCGAVGLSTAVLLQQQGCPVTIYARELPPDTTSNIAGGQWSPFSVYAPEEASARFLELFRRACRLAYSAFQQLDRNAYGIRWTVNYFLGHEPFELPPFFAELPDLYPDLRPVAPEEHPFPRQYGFRFTTPQIETPHYLAALLDNFRRGGGSIVVKELHGRQDVLDLQEDIVINCTGLGSRQLFDDRSLVPIKGQLTILEPQPEIDYIVAADDAFLYMMPRRDGILLGGSFEEDIWELEPSAEVEDRVIEGHRALFAWPKTGPASP